MRQQVEPFDETQFDIDKLKIAHSSTKKDYKF